MPRESLDFDHVSIRLRKTTLVQARVLATAAKSSLSAWLGALVEQAIAKAAASVVPTAAVAVGGRPQRFPKVKPQQSSVPMSASVVDACRKCGHAKTAHQKSGCFGHCTCSESRFQA